MISLKVLKSLNIIKNMYLSSNKQIFWKDAGYAAGYTDFMGTNVL